MIPTHDKDFFVSHKLYRRLRRLGMSRTQITYHHQFQERGGIEICFPAESIDATLALLSQCRRYVSRVVDRPRPAGETCLRIEEKTAADFVFRFGVYRETRGKGLWYVFEPLPLSGTDQLCVFRRNMLNEKNSDIMLYEDFIRAVLREQLDYVEPLPSGVAVPLVIVGEGEDYEE